MNGQNDRKKTELLRSTLDARIIAVVRERMATDVPDIVSALQVSGIAVIEITLTTPDAFRLISHLSTIPELIVGAGSVLSRLDAERAIAAGATFLASPITDAGVIESARGAGVISMPGGLTPNELSAAGRAGGDLIKVFPLPEDGAAYIRAIRAPMPDLKLAPSGGITSANAAALLAAGASVLNVGSWLTPPEADLKTRIELCKVRAGELLEAVRV